VDAFLKEHRFTGVDHRRRVSRLPLSRWCCPLSVAVERGDASLVVALLNREADPLKPLELLGQRHGGAGDHQEAREILEWAAGSLEETGRVPPLLLADSVIRCALADVSPALRKMQRGDPLVRRSARGA